MSSAVLARAVQGFRYVLASQLSVLALGLVKAFVIPFFLGIENYGYWQIYVFYTAYVGVLGLGFSDGLYLRYGGVDVADLPFSLLRPSVQLYSFLLVVAGLLVAWAYSHDSDPDRRVVMYLVAANVIVMGLLAVFSYVLQATNQFRAYGIFNSADKILFFGLLPPFVMFGVDSYLFLAVADLAAKIFVLVILVVTQRHFAFGSNVRYVVAFVEFSENIKSGIQLMVANVSGMLVLGVGRFIIEYFGSLEGYAHYAFGVSMTNLALVAISAISVVTYPALKRIPETAYGAYYDSTSKRLFVFSNLMLMVYFPVVLLVEEWLPKYVAMIPFLNALFAIAVLQGKMQLLNNTYYKAMRKERAMLIANLTSLAVVTALSVGGYAITESIDSIAYAALLTMLYRVYASERFLRRQMGDNSNGILILEYGVLMLFLAATSFLQIYIAALIAMVEFCVVLFLMRRELRSLLALLRGRVL